MSIFSCNVLSVNSLKCVSMNNQECKIRSGIINFNSNEPLFHPFSILVNKCSGSCNNINDPYAKLCVPDVVKNINVEVFNLIPKRHIEWHETCKCKCRLDASVSNNKQRWNEDKFRCEYKELIDKGICDKEFIWNPSNCEFECDKSCDVREYLDYENCKCRKKIFDKLVEECSENIDENKIVYNGTLNAIPLFIIFLITSINISSVFIYFPWYLKKIIFMLSLILILKQQFIKCNSIECNSVEDINGKHKRKKHKKSNILLF